MLFETAGLVDFDDIRGMTFQEVGLREPIRPDRRGRPRPQRVLVVDDNADICQLWHTYLTLSGFAVMEAVNGVDAVEKALQAAPAAIVIDFDMPGMNGADVVHELRHHASTTTTPVIGLTAEGEPSSLEFRRVCDTVLDKPVRPEDLLDALRGTLRRGTASSAERPEVLSAKPR